MVSSRTRSLNPDSEGGTGRWSIDHLYLDQDGVPTLVEVKRRSDTRSRREVVGQMLDYAANGPAYWPTDKLRARFAATHASQTVEPDDALISLVGDGIDPDAFWTTVEENLRSGRIRLVFVVDDMPPELLHIVQFLSRQMRDTEVYAVEVRQHVGPSGQLLATSVLGQSVTPTVRTGRTMSQVSMGEWLTSMNARCDPEEKTVLASLTKWMEEQGSSTFVTVAQNPSFGMSVKEAGKDRFPFGITPNKRAAIYLGYLTSSSAYSSDESRQAIVDAVAKAGVLTTVSSLRGDIRIPLSDLADASVRSRFLAVLNGLVAMLKSVGEQ